MSRQGGFLLLLTMALGVFAVVYLLFGESMTTGSSGGGYAGAGAVGDASYLTGSGEAGLEAHGTKPRSAEELAADEAARAAAARERLKSEGIYGIVMDGRGNVIPRATVMLLPDPPERRRLQGSPDLEPLHSALTDERGAFVVGPSPKDGYAKLRAEAGGYAPTVQRVRQRGARVDLILDRGGAMEVRLLDMQGAAVSDATVLHQAGTVVTSARSDEEGVVRFRALPTGTGSLLVTKRGYGAVRDQNVAVAPGETEKRTLVLPRGIEVAGVVMEAGTERPIDRAQVLVRYPQLPSLEIDGAPEEIATFTDEEGRFKTTAFVGGQERALVRVHKDGFAEGRAWRTAQNKGEVVLKLQKAGEAFQGRVLDAERQPLGGVQVTYAWQQSEKPAEIPETTTDESGEFALPLPAWAGPGSGWTVIAVSEAAGVGTGQASVPREGKPRAKELEIQLGGTGSVAGTVTDAGGTPVQGAVVTLAPDWGAARSRAGRKRIPWQLLRILYDGAHHNLTAVSGADGAYTIPAVPALAYKASASFGLDQATMADSVDVEAGETAQADISLGEGGTIEGWVLDSEEKPIAGAYVWASVQQRRGGSGSWTSNRTARSQSDGKFVLRGISDEDYQLRANASGYGSAQEKNVRKDARDVTLRLKARGWIEGVVREQGRPFRGMFTVTVQPTGNASGPMSLEMSRFVNFSGSWRPGQQTRTFNTDDGRFTVKGLNAGDYIVRATTSDGLIAVQEDLVTVRDGRASREAGLELTVGAIVTGEIRDDETGRPLPNIWVYANPKSGGTGTPGPSGHTQTDRQGRYEIKGLGTSTYTVSAWVGGANIVKSIDLVTGERRTVNLAKERPGTVTFVVTAEDGAPIAGARPNIQTGGGGWVSVNVGQMRKDGLIGGRYDWRALYNTNADGVLTRYHVPPGAARVWVTRSGYQNSERAEITVRSGGNTEVAVTLTKKP